MAFSGTDGRGHIAREAAVAATDIQRVSAWPEIRCGQQMVVIGGQAAVVVVPFLGPMVTHRAVPYLRGLGIGDRRHRSNPIPLRRPSRFTTTAGRHRRGASVERKARDRELFDLGVWVVMRASRAGSRTFGEIGPGGTDVA